MQMHVQMHVHFWACMHRRISLPAAWSLLLEGVRRSWQNMLANTMQEIQCKQHDYRAWLPMQPQAFNVNDDDHCTSAPKAAIKCQQSWHRQVQKPWLGKATSLSWASYYAREIYYHARKLVCSTSLRKH